MQQDRPARSSDVYATSMRSVWAGSQSPETVMDPRAGDTPEERKTYWQAMRLKHEALHGETPNPQGKTIIVTRPKPVLRPLVYYVRFSDRIKIGTTYNLKQRLRDLPHDEVLATEPGGIEVERERHKTFAKWRVTGEWFQDNPALREHIATLT